MIEGVVTSLFKGVLDETDYLDLFQTGFRPGFGTKTVLVGLMDDRRQGLDRGNASFLVLLDLSAAFDTINHGILTWGLGTLLCNGSASA